MLEGLLEDHFELGLVERLGEEIGRAQPDRLHDDVRAALAGDDDDGHVLVDLLEGGKRSQPVHTAGHHDVEEDRRGAFGMKAAQRFVGVGHCERAAVVRTEERAEEPAHREIVVDNQHL